jgi:hypothetical protein
MLHTNYNYFNWRADNATTPSTSSVGTSLTPGNNTKGSWVTCIASGSVTEDVYGIFIALNGAGVSALAKDCIVDIGIDPAGGTSFTVVLADLYAGNNGVMNANGGGFITFYFPLFIKSGSTIGARASVNNATVGTVRAKISIFGKPSAPELFKTAAFVRSYGTDAANSRGTAVTIGASSSEGSWTSIGTIADDNVWHWQLGCGINENAYQDTTYVVDMAIGDGSNKFMVMENIPMIMGDAETIGTRIMNNTTYQAANGATIYVRAVSDLVTPDATAYFSVYGAGG